jgi:hypothetical protein
VCQVLFCFFLYCFFFFCLGVTFKVFGDPLESVDEVSRTIAAIVVHSSSEDQLDSDILLPETNEYEAFYFD